MLPLSRPTLALAGALLFGCAVRAQSFLPLEPLPFDSLAAFRPTGANWRLAGGLGGDPRHDKILTPLPGAGLLVNTPTKEAHDQLFTTWEHGDLEVDLDFLLPPGGDSGLYLQGRYEVQLRDSWSVRVPKFSDCGGLGQAWDDTREKGHQGTGGAAPLANACRAPGLWQHLHVEFRAPRFGADGRKTANARFTKVTLNGFVIHENVEVTGAMRGAAFTDEKPLGPLMIQGSNLNGAVAVRRLAFKRSDAEARLAVDGLGYKLFPGEFEKFGAYDGQTPKSEGALARFSQAAVEKNGRFALVFTGSFVAPRAGDYAFAVETGDAARLLVDDRPVVLQSGAGGPPGAIALTAGAHAFRLDLIHTGWARPSLEVVAEGPGIAPQPLTTPDSRTRFDRGPRQLLVEPKDRVLLQRCFVPFEPKKRLYAASIGTPAGVHYAYDFETGALLRVWRGRFLDTFEMWDGRGENQIGKPAGPALTLNARPAVALIEFPRNGGWPDQADAMQSSQGYTLEPDGQPVFLAKLSSLTIRDRIAPSANGRGLTRTLNLAGKLTDWSAWVLLAESDAIAPQPGGGGWIVGDREWYLDWPADSGHAPVIRSTGGRQQLAVRLTKDTLEIPVVYTLVW